MTQSPKKQPSRLTYSTINRGVEAKEIEIANTRLDIDTASWTHGGAAESSASAAVQLGGERLPEYSSQTTLLPTSDETGSFIQVVVQKHRQKREPTTAAAAAQTSTRLPTASSPIRREHDAALQHGAARMVLATPLLLTSHTGWTSNAPRILVETATSPHAPRYDDKRKIFGNGESDTQRKVNNQNNHNIRPSFWKKISDYTMDKLDSLNSGPERVEVYYFEQSSGEYLSTVEGGAVTRTERAARRGARAAASLLAEILAAPQMLLGMPIAVFLNLYRMVLLLLRGAIVGLVQTTADYAWKPALALLFNAIIQPPLVLVANTLRAVREALRPLWAVVGDALEPAARTLAAVRLVHVSTSISPLHHRARPCHLS